MFFVVLAALLAAPPLRVPPAALYDQPGQTTVVTRARPAGEPVRGVVEYVASLAAFTLVNAVGAYVLDDVTVTVKRGGGVTFNGNEGKLGAAIGCFALSPFAAALTSWAVGKGSDRWDPSLGWASVGAYGTSVLAVGAGLGLALADVPRGTAQAANAGLYLAVPLGTVLLQNATKDPLP